MGQKKHSLYLNFILKAKFWNMFRFRHHEVGIIPEKLAIHPHKHSQIKKNSQKTNLMRLFLNIFKNETKFSLISAPWKMTEILFTQCLDSLSTDQTRSCCHTTTLTGNQQLARVMVLLQFSSKITLFCWLIGFRQVSKGFKKVCSTVSSLDIFYVLLLQFNDCHL